MKSIEFTKTAVQDYVLNIKDRNDEDLDFIKTNLENTLILKEIDEINKLVKVTRYENTRSYDLPIYLFEIIHEDDELLEQKQSEQKQTEIISEFSIEKIERKHIVAGLIIISLIGIIWTSSNFSSANLLTTGPITKQLNDKEDFYRLQTEKQNKNNLLKSTELQEQKRLRKELEESINKVKTYDAENDAINKQLILLSQ